MSCNCNKCGNDPCSCGGCQPARYSCDFSIEVDPFNPYIWLLNNCGKLSRINIPKIPETCTSLQANFSAASLVYNGECGQDVITGRQLGQLINLDDLRDVDVADADSCDLMVFDPGCTACGDGCKPKPAMWRKYHIPDAEDCEVEPDSDGYYHVLIKDDCGCIKECRMLPSDTVYEYGLRDAWPNDPDWPFSVGSRMGNNSEIIDLQLDTKVPIFGKTDLEVTVQYAYGIQNTTPAGQTLDEKNFKSMVIPTSTPTHNPSVTDMLQNTWTVQGVNMHPWGSAEWQVSRTVLVPKGQKLYLTHIIEVRMVKNGGIAIMPYGGESDTPADDSSRLHALRVVVKAAKGVRL